MADPEFHIKQGDSQPVLQATLQDDDGTVVDLTNVSSVAFRLRERSGTTLVVNGTADVVGPATGGVVKYEWEADDLADAQGLHYGEFLLTYSDGTVLTVPNGEDDWIKVYVTPDLA